MFWQKHEAIVDPYKSKTHNFFKDPREVKPTDLIQSMNVSKPWQPDMRLESSDQIKGKHSLTDRPSFFHSLGGVEGNLRLSHSQSLKAVEVIR